MAGVWGTVQAIPPAVPGTEEKEGQQRTKYKNNLGQPIALTSSSAVDGRGGGPQGVGPSRPIAPMAPPVGVDTGRYVAPSSGQEAMRKAMANMQKNAKVYQDTLAKEDYSMSGVGEDTEIGRIDTDIFQGMSPVSKEAYKTFFDAYTTGKSTTEMDTFMNNYLTTNLAEIRKRYEAAIEGFDNRAKGYEENKDMLVRERAAAEETAPNMYRLDTGNLTDLERVALDRAMSSERHAGALGARAGADIGLSETLTGYDESADSLQALKDRYELEVTDAENAAKQAYQNIADSFKKADILKTLPAYLQEDGSYDATYLAAQPQWVKDMMASGLSASEAVKLVIQQGGDTVDTDIYGKYTNPGHAIL